MFSKCISFVFKWDDLEVTHLLITSFKKTGKRLTDYTHHKNTEKEAMRSKMSAPLNHDEELLSGLEYRHS